MPKFLILRFSSIGDIVLTSPVVRCLKNQVKDAEVHFVTKKQFSPVVEHNPFIDKKFYFEDNLRQLLRQLKKERYDYIIDLHKNIRTFWIKLSLVKKSFSFDKLNFEKWLLVNFKINRLPAIHIVDRYLATVKSFGVVNDNKGLDYFLPDEINEQYVHRLLPEPHNNYIAFVIGAKHATKRLPQEKIISICKKIPQPVILLGGKEDAESAAGISSSAGSNIYNICGKTTLHESSAIVKYAAAVITHDTGLMHIASAFNKKIISVWGNTIPEFGMYPYIVDKANQPVIAEVKGLSCRPCTKLGYEKCPKVHFRCMREIDEETLVYRVEKKI